VSSRFIGLATLSLFAFSAFAACTEAPMTSDEMAQDAEFAASQEPICANGDGVNSAMAALAAATAKELGRWSPTTDFAAGTAASKWYTTLTSTGKARCADGKCANVQAILDLQASPPNTVKFGSVVFNANNFVSQLTSNWNAQKNCELRGGTGATNCSAEQHKLTFVSKTAGACDTLFTYNATNPSGGALTAPAQLKNKLIFFGGTSNPYLSFSSTGTTVSIDPTYGLADMSTTSTGSCSAACIQISSASLTGACCSCNGVTKKFVKASFNASTYLCQ
jgi:hypothetical protein